MDYIKGFSINKYKSEIDEISETASKEYGNMKTMAKMQEDWEPLEFACRGVPEKESYILDGESIELIQATLDDHIIKT
jgi:dynein heavy chain